MATKGVNGLPDLSHPNEIDISDGPDWLLSPATIEPIESVEDFNSRANAYFKECFEREARPTITGLALATGLPGPTSLIRLGQRVPILRHSISRCMTAVAYGYEQIIALGGASGGAQFMLKNIPDFDPEDPEGAPGVQFFNDRKEVLLQADVYGAAIAGEAYDDDVDPIDVYLSVIKKPGGIGKTSSLQPTQTSPRQRLFSIISSEGDE